MVTLNKTIHAMKAARNIIGERISISAASKRHDVDRTTIGHTLIILTNGTPEEIAHAWTGKVVAKTIADKIRARMTPEERKAYRSVRQAHAVRHMALPLEVELWAKIMPVLRALTELPNQKDTVNLLKRNRMRTKFIDANLETAVLWLMQFENEWRRYKGDQSKDNNSDT